MTVSATEFELVLIIALVACVLSGLWTSWAVRDAYEQLGRGELALDVSDRVEPPALESPRGQAEVRQLLDAIATVQRTRGDHDV